MCETEDRLLLQQIFEALQQKGYDPVGQIVEYLLTEDPTYITNHDGARQRICKIDRDKLLRDIVASFFAEDEQAATN